MFKMTARTPEDLLAAIPLVLGFHPEESLVMLTFGGRHPFHARIDLPAPEEAEALIGALLPPARREGVEQVVFAFYSAAGSTVDAVGDAVAGRFRAAGIEVLEILRVHDDRWFRVGKGRSAFDVGTLFAVEGHPFRAQAVVEGIVTVGSRSEVAARLDTDPCAALCVASELETAADLGLELEQGEARFLADQLVEQGRVPDDREAAALMLAAGDLHGRFTLWWGLLPEEVEGHLTLWVDLIQRAPDVVLADVAGVLACVAWLAGQGTLAWCAVDRCRASAPRHVLAEVVTEFLEQAVPPIRDWQRFSAPASGPTAA